MRDLSVFFNDVGGFADYSKEARDYLRDSFQLDFIVADSDELIIGLYKPFKKLFFEIQSAAVAPISLSVEYWNGSSYAALANVDETLSLNRSGFLSWEKPEDWALNTENSQELFYIKVRPNQDCDITFKGINLVFSDDNDLRSEHRLIDDQLAKGDDSFIAYHLSARNEIIQSLRNSGYTTKLTQSNVVNDLTQWDILDPEQIRNASKFLALSKIMFDVSSNVDDKWYQKYADYKAFYGEAFKLYLLSLDFDDDGKKDPEEQNYYRTVRMQKV